MGGGAGSEDGRVNCHLRARAAKTSRGMIRRTIRARAAGGSRAAFARVSDARGARTSATFIARARSRTDDERRAKSTEWTTTRRFRHEDAS